MIFTNTARVERQELQAIHKLRHPVFSYVDHFLDAMVYVSGKKKVVVPTSSIYKMSYEDCLDAELELTEALRPVLPRKAARSVNGMQPRYVLRLGIKHRFACCS